ncbi:MAG: methyl-accepting chemotaxis protein [Lacrimispora sp.]|uniref:methyl-accepting chemotaxis protein n=1 Tax=Lacrimispora sp. TaxID=2719234 RepID=UPI0039E35C5E
MNLRKMKLAAKTSLVMAGVLSVSLIVLISATVLFVRKEMGETIDSEFSGIAEQNGIIVQGIIDDAANVAQGFQDYLEESYAEYDEMLVSQAVDSQGNKVPFPTKKSAVYETELMELNYEVENYILHNAWTTVKNNPDIIGIGAYFEPYAYDESVKDYSLYVNEEGAMNQTAETDVPYEEYGGMEWYSVAASSQKKNFTNPYAESGVTMVTASFPIVSGGKTQGVIVVDIAVENFAKTKSSDEKYPTMFTDILTQDGTIVYDSESPEFTGQNLSDLVGSEIYNQISEKAKAGSAFKIEAAYEGTELVEYYYPIQAGEEIWWSSTALEKSDLNKAVRNLCIFMVIMAVCALAVIISITVLLLRKMLSPINGVVAAAEKVVRGELDIHVDIRSEDEIGMLSKAFAEMSDRLKTIISDVGYLLGEMSEGNFRLLTSHEEKYIGEFQNILLAMGGISQNLSRTLNEINVVSDQVSAGSEQVSNGAQVLSQGATEQASSIEELSAAILEVSQRIKENAENASDAGQLSNQAGTGVMESSRHMDALIGAMEEIKSSSSEIGKIIKTIDDIAFQTNILALNAAVEAARAGEAGKGFAVVADEVRSLAARCAEAAKSTTELINSAVSAVATGTDHASETAQSLKTVVKNAEIMDEKIQQIARASEEQSQAIAQITTGIEGVSAVVQTNSATAEESAGASEELSGQAQILKNLVGQFQLR